MLQKNQKDTLGGLPVHFLKTQISFSKAKAITLLYENICSRWSLPRPIKPGMR